LKLNSRLGLCDFLKSKNISPPKCNFKEGNLKKNANTFHNFLLVFTNVGPQIHFIQDFNTPIKEDFLKQNILKSMQWDDSSNNKMYRIAKLLFKSLVDYKKLKLKLIKKYD